MKKTKKNFGIAAILLGAFVVWTAAVQLVDVQPIGPQGSTVGFATVNSWVHNLTGVHMSLYTVTDWLGLVPIAFTIGFALLGLIQWVKRKHLRQVDFSILVLGGFYLLVMAAYVLFEVFVINYRPVLINGCLEASYPSSTTMLVLCVMPTTLMQLNARIKSQTLKRWVGFGITAFILFMVIGRLLSGVHWFTDIIGGALFSAGFVMLYHSITSLEIK
ncbi:MAG: phosphatase PAP2 family protein [Ruminococcaceae bacterium]|nr:phosphatase PAP2 family protein [Oscillospiraceae bacterium]